MVGLQAGAIHPSRSDNSIQLRKSNSARISDFRNHKRPQPVHLKLTRMLQILAVVEKDFLSYSKRLLLNVAIMLFVSVSLLFDENQPRIDAHLNPIIHEAIPQQKYHQTSL